jgi:hypothetical protein
MSEHWLEHAHGRIVAGDDELDVLADYGWVQITAEEREAIEFAVSQMRITPLCMRKAAIIRSLLERLQ